jgi:hypothetical protein
MTTGDAKREASSTPMSCEEGRALLNEQARRYLGISGDEFVRKWDAGEFPDADRQPGVMRDAMLLPLVRSNA